MYQDKERKVDIQLRLSELSPYLSIILIRNENSIKADKHGDLLQVWVQKILSELPKKTQRTIKNINSGEYIYQNFQFRYTTLWYSELKTSSWTKQIEIRDFINQVVIMTSLDNFSALYFSDNDMKGNFIYFLHEQEYQDLWPRPIERNRLNAIFVRGPARTLWLTGIHQRRSIRADAKTLMGINIRDALNPLDDQSFYFTSARCYQKDWKKTTGVSPEKSQIWIRKTQNWDDYCNLIGEVLIRVKDRYSQLDESPFSILAIPQINLDSVRSAYDVNFLYPETSAEDARDEDQEIIQLLEDLSYNTIFEVNGNPNSASLEAKVLYNGVLLGVIRFEFDTKDKNKQDWQFIFTPEKNTVKIHPKLTEISYLIKNGKFLQIRYKSGHTFSGGVFFRQQFRDLPFGGWIFEDFSNYSVDKEKPSTESKIGKDGSLFCWIWNKYSNNGWLYCDDSSGEVADFVKFEIIKQIPKISLIHVKAAHGTDKRQFSVSTYEVVTAQAVKNLRHFELKNLIGKLQRKKGQHFLYRIKKNGSIPTDEKEATQFRDEFITDLKAHGANSQREVIVLQPHNRQSFISGGSVNTNARCQLHTLLLSTEATCKSLGSTFNVITDQD